jgi:hypothetical protein
MTTALEGGKGSSLYPRERPGTHCTGGWVDPSAGLDRCEKSCPTGIRSPDRAARNQSLYRLSYSAQFRHYSFLKYILVQNCVFDL